jgi:hypothetical protein
MNHDKNSKVSPFTNDVALHVDNENGCLPIQEIGIEILTKPNLHTPPFHAHEQTFKRFVSKCPKISTLIVLL